MFLPQVHLLQLIGSPWLSTTVPFIVLCCCTTSMAAEAVCNPHAGAKVAIVKNRATGKVVPFIKFFLFIYVYVHDISIILTDFIYRHYFRMQASYGNNRHANHVHKLCDIFHQPYRVSIGWLENAVCYSNSVHC